MKILCILTNQPVEKDYCEKQCLKYSDQCILLEQPVT